MTSVALPAAARSPGEGVGERGRRVSEGRTSHLDEPAAMAKFEGEGDSRLFCLVAMLLIIDGTRQAYCTLSIGRLGLAMIRRYEGAGSY